MIGCTMSGCPYHNNKNQLCNKAIVIINQYGQCNEIYDCGGRPKKLDREECSVSSKNAEVKK
jgi:hypothetical protein